ncbi:TetR/AcrR family transcriptional regulator [Bacillus salitolerans]|uniref:TetR/AcrR family transcriptional regulator n=1 Tax=Bacillus salitolerans TaxID=1437434 RepID=A0ABW4LL05_9BACI
MSEQEWIQDLLHASGEDEIKFSEKQLKIIEAAAVTFAEKGFAATSTSEIAKKAGVAEGTIFRHYKTKKDLLFSIVRPTIERLLAPHLAKSFAKDVFTVQYESYEDFLRKLAKNRYEFLNKHFPILKIFLQEIAFHEELREPYMRLFQQHIYPNFEKTIIHFQQKKEIIDWPPKDVMRLTITSLLGTLLAMKLNIAKDSYEAEIDKAVTFIMKGLSR